MAFCHCFFWPLSICKIGICCTTKIGDTYWTNNGRTRANHCIYYNLQNRTHNKRFVFRVGQTLALNGNVTFAVYAIVKLKIFKIAMPKILASEWRLRKGKSVAEITLRFFLRRIRLDNLDTCF